MTTKTLNTSQNLNSHTYENLHSGYRKYDILPQKNSNTYKLKQTDVKTSEKVAKYAFYILTAGLGYIASQTVNGIYHSIRVTYLEFKGRKQIFNNQFETEDQDLSVTYAQLNKMKLLSASSIRCFNKIFHNNYQNNNFYIFENGIPENQELIQKINENKTVVIPIIIKGKGPFKRDHITTLIINPNQKLIIFNDPKGRSLQELESKQVDLNIMDGNNKETKKLSEILNLVLLAVKEPASWSVYQNTKRYQKDGYNCGVHLLHTAENYIANQTLTEKLEKIADVRKYRETLLSKIDNNSSGTPFK